MTVSLYRAEVLSIRPLTARMHRITIGGEGLRGFAGGRDADERFKLLLPHDGEHEPQLPTFTDDAISFAQNGRRPPMRTLTVRHFDPAGPTLDFDLAIHPGGAASDWAVRARIGDPVGIAGPRGGYRPGPHISRHLLAGDDAALPAIATILERLPAGSRADALIEVEDAGDELDLLSPATLSVTWLHRDGAPRGEHSPLAQAVRELPLHDDGNTQVWAAGEASTMRAIRRHLRDELHLARSAFQVSGYWREHLTEDEAISADQHAIDAARAAGKTEAEIEDATTY